MRGFLLLLAIVLAAIGVGIGAEVAAGPPAYGPPGAQFTAAFPRAPAVGRVVLHGLGGEGYVYDAQIGDQHLQVTLSIVPGSGWTGYGPVDGPAVHLGLRGASGRLGRFAARRLRLGGVRVERSVACVAGSCVGVLAGLTRPDGGRLADWTAWAGASSRGRVRSLLDSVSPVAPLATPRGR